MPRILAAILKVAGNNLDEVNRCIHIACCDYRDMLCLAEYPNQSGRWDLKKKDPEAYAALVRKDLGQFQAWIDQYTQ